jgi:hypothetical protein
MMSSNKQNKESRDKARAQKRREASSQQQAASELPCIYQQATNLSGQAIDGIILLVESLLQMV